MTIEVKKPCCESRNCSRIQPIRLLRSAINGEWLVVTQYSEKKDGILEIFQYHVLDQRDADTLNKAQSKAKHPAGRKVETVETTEAL
jgi:hypothetical protein